MDSDNLKIILQEKLNKIYPSIDCKQTAMIETAHIIHSKNYAHVRCVSSSLHNRFEPYTPG